MKIFNMKKVVCKTILLLLSVLATNAGAQTIDAGMIKSVKGDVVVERDGNRLPARLGATVLVSDTIVVGLDGSVGITLIDGTLLSAGPKSSLSLNKFFYDSTTSKGALDVTLKRGTLAVVSGKLSKTSKDTVVYRTPTSILGVRGTEFIIETETKE